MTTSGDGLLTLTQIEEIRCRLLPEQPTVLPGISDVDQTPDLFPLGDDAAPMLGARIMAATVQRGTRDAMIASARKLIGIGEHPPGSNYNPEVVGWFNTHIARIGNGAWCDMSVTEEAYDSGCEDAVLGGGNGRGFAYVPAHMAWGAHTYGIHHGSVPPAGAIVGFRWDGAKSTTDCDHIGLCEKNLEDGTFYDLEGNTSDVFARRHRDLTYVSCWFMPAYAAPHVAPPPEEEFFRRRH